MKKTNENIIATIFGLLIAFLPFILVALLLIPLTMWTDRTLDFWCTQWSGHFVNIPTWLSFLVTIIGNGIMFVLNIVSEIVRLCI